MPDDATPGGVGDDTVGPVAGPAPLTAPVDPGGGRVDLSVGAGAQRVPGWIIRAIIVFWLGFLAVGLLKHMWNRLDALMLLLVISLFLALAIEPGVNRLAQRGWRRGRATA
ncbi:MAG TPA: AI-2E family transporter, partial [Acidimicrobiia bacterium]|nr:AI-2E family transporter [Acidimicrobiia bacterium]